MTDSIIPCKFCQQDLTLTVGTNYSNAWCLKCHTDFWFDNNTKQCEHIAFLLPEEIDYESVYLDFFNNRTTIFIKTYCPITHLQIPKGTIEIAVDGVFDINPSNAVQMAKRIHDLKAFL